MLCHSVPPIPSWRPTNIKMPMDDLPFPSDLDDDLDQQTPEPPEYGPVPPVIVH
jgi:hypothetical protein